ncbi:DUF445 domain-containing protein [Oleiphilus messinensis]|nr:hypothetical protein [Oleiphilus messinensis]
MSTICSNYCTRDKQLELCGRPRQALSIPILFQVAAYIVNIDVILSHPDLWKYISIPIVAGLVGWSTNWLAVKLMFVPLEFKGYKPFFLGWQGVIPSKAEKMAKVIVDKGLQSLATVSEVYNQIDRSALSEQIVKMMDPRIEEYVDDLMNQDNAALWEKVPDAFKRRIYENVRKQMPIITDKMLEDIGDKIDDMFDLEDMVVSILTKNKELLNRIFLEAGKAEFKFIVSSGMYFGAAFGLLQMALWIFTQNWWILPLFGLIVGYATNAIALKIIFKPLHPVHFGPYTIQGLFLKRQSEVARVLCRITTEEVITINNILYSMLTGPKSERTKRLIQTQVRKAIDETTSWGSLGIGTPITRAFIGTQSYIDLKAQAAELALNTAESELMHNKAFSEGQSEIIFELLRSRMEELSTEEFQDVIRPAFQEDEWKLIILGALLGLAAGFAQLFGMFGGIM